MTALLKKNLIFIIVFSSGFITALLIQQFYQKKVDDLQFKTIREQGYKYTSPLLYVESPQENSEFVENIHNQLKDYIDEIITKDLAVDVSVYLRYPNLSDWTIINPDSKYSPASLLKVPIMMLFYNRAENDPKILTQEIKFDIPDQNLMTNYKPQEALEKDKSYQIGELVRRMIVFSDNAAEDLLISKTSKDDFNRIFDEINVERLNFEQQENSMDVKTYSHFFRVLYNSTFLTRRSSEKALEVLTHTTFDKGIVASIPNNIQVAHKFGERYIEDIQQAQLHDCGIVYLPNNPYLLCIMTRGKDFKDLEKVLQNISQITYNYSLKQTK